MLDFKSNKIHDLYHWFKSGLKTDHGEREQAAIANEVFFRLFGLSATQRILEAEKRLPESDIVILKKVQRRLNLGEPVQYITGVTDFLNHPIHVRPGILIPRQETEGLVLWLKEKIEADKRGGDKGCHILDVGTGSGCMAIALAGYFPFHRVLACDISEKILEVARYNALINNVKIDSFVLDVFSEGTTGGFEGAVDYIISNPPYVRESEKTVMAGNVTGYEPSQALFVPDNDPLIYYRAIASRAMQWLRPGGWVFFEINEALANQCLQQMAMAGFMEASIRQDIHDRDRYLRARKPC